MCFLYVYFLGEFLSSHTSRENVEMLYSPSLNRPEGIATFLGAVLNRLKYQILPCSPCWLCFYQDYTIISSLMSHKLFSMQQLSYWNRSWTHIWAWKLSSRRWLPIVWGSPQDSSYLVRRCNYPEVHVSDTLHLNWTITSPKQKVIYKFAFCLEGWITFNVIINHQCVLRGCRLSVCMYLWTSVIRRLTSVVDPVYVLSLRLQCLNHVHR